MGEPNDPSVKKRSLSSYLSNVNLRREELEKLKKKQEKEKEEKKEEEKRVNQNAQQQQQQQQQMQDKLRKEGEALEKKTSTESIQPGEAKQPDDPSIEHKIQHESNESENERDENFEEAGMSNHGDTKDKSIKGTHSNQPLGGLPEILRPSENRQTSGSRTSSLTRKDLHLMLKEPEGRVISKTETHDTDVDRDPRNTHTDDEEEDVESDAPTEPASPPKPRRGRLIRGDRLQSMSPSHSTFDNESDSELSDIDELKSVHISSSIIHGDSSPFKSTQDETRRRQQTSSPRADKGRLQSPRLGKPHIAVPKISRHKKGVYRDAGGRTRLQISCDKGNYEQARKLIEEDHYNVNDQDNAGNTALHEAALNGHLDIVKLLTRNGADVNIQSFEMFKDTPLIDASANGHLDVVKFLLSHGADPTICNAKGLTAYDSIEEDSDLDEQEQEIVSEIKHHLRSAAKTWKSDMPIHSISLVREKHQKNFPQRRLASEELLGDFEFFWTDITSRAGKQKLFKASKEGKLSYVGSYLENGGRVDLKSFFEAVKLGHEDVTSLFLAFGAQVNATSKDGSTALISAVGRGHVGTVKLLLEAGADPRRRDKNGKTALYYAENSLMGVVDSEEVSLIRKSLLKFGAESKDVEEKSEKSEEQLMKREDSNEEDDENVISVGRKRRTVSPDRPETKRRASEIATNIDESLEHIATSEGEGGSKTLSVEADTIKPQEETPEEKEQRLKAEEEYIQRRLQIKRKKEQEVLKKLAQDEEQREKERAEQRIKEAEKMVEQQRLKKIELDNQKKEIEILRRRKIRSLYPLGLRLIDFNDATNPTDFLPLYYTELGDENTKYVLDLHLFVMLKSPGLVPTCDKIPVGIKYKRQLWNILKSTFLYGGLKNRHLLNWDALDLQSQMQFDTQEYTKFSKLPMNWVKMQDIQIDDASTRQQILQNMVQMVLVNTDDEIVAPRNSIAKQPTKYATQATHALALPNKFQKRHTVSQLLQNYNSQPLW